MFEASFRAIHYNLTDQNSSSSSSFASFRSVVSIPSVNQPLDGGKEVADFGGFALGMPEAGEAYRRAELQHSCFESSRGLNRILEIRLGIACKVPRHILLQVPNDPVQLGSPGSSPRFSACTTPDATFTCSIPT